MLKEGRKETASGSFKIAINTQNLPGGSEENHRYQSEKA
jgi:hypothetical protein